jgi:hypothetical protein
MVAALGMAVNEARFYRQAADELGGLPHPVSDDGR